MDANREIGALLERSAAAWNRGDLAAFMESYERSPGTVYVNARGAIRGYDAIAAHYAAAGPPGTLSFSGLAIEVLGGAHALVVGRYHIEHPDGSKPTGMFTLVLRRGDDDWHIIADHSS